MVRFNFTKRQWATLLVMSLADFCNAICVSLQAPFFPKEAEKKGATATEYGLVFGVFEFIVFIISPIYGQYLNKIGPKVLFNSGIFTTGISAILFGLLDRVEGHTAFIALAFIIRIVEALGNAAFLTASFAIIAKEFPNNIATTFASLETFFGLGLIVGPMVGGGLYSVGGYYLPFVVLGGALFVTAILTLCVLPKHTPDVNGRDKGPSLTTVLRIPGVLVCSLAISATSASIGFLSATMEPHLRQFLLSPILLGLIFVINGGVYALTAPIWGWMVDKSTINPKTVSFFGCLLIAAGFCLIGPASFIPLETDLNLVIVGLVLHGLGIAAILVSSFTDALATSIKKGLPDNIETYGLISGLWTSTFAFGAFVGPSLSGALYDSIGFRGSVCFIIGLHIIVGIVIVLFLSCERSKRRKQLYKEIISTESLIKSSTDTNGSNNVIGSLENTAFISRSYEKAIAIEHCRPLGMNSLMVVNSYSNKTSHWSRYEERSDSETPVNFNISQNYGSFDMRQETIA